MLRYGIMGTAISVLYSLCIVLLIDAFALRNATLASVLAFVIVQPLAYFAHRQVTFFDSARDAMEPVRFSVTTVASFLVTTAGMYLVTEIFLWSYLFGIALNWLLIPAMNFLIYLIWVFRVEEPARIRTSTGAVSDDR
ncbi:MAG TPA: GtrA family protein [Stellaceae bacterium]|nr:GtrA family protein [Stellaceae bacterium]